MEDQVWSQPKGYVTDPIRIGNGIPDPAGGRAPEGRTGRTERSGERNHGEALRAAHAAQGARISHRAAQSGFPGNQGRLCG